MDFFNKLKEDIQAQAKCEIDQIHYEINTMHNEVIDKFKNGLNKEIEVFLETELKELKVKEVSLDAQYKLAFQKELRSKRQIMVNDLFLELKNKLIDFTKTNEYKEYLKSKISEIWFNKGKIIAKKQDLDLIKSMIVAKGLEYEEGFLEIGGFIYYDLDHSLYNCSLDEAFEEQKEYFISHSKFLL